MACLWTSSSDDLQSRFSRAMFPAEMFRWPRNPWMSLRAWARSRSSRGRRAQSLQMCRAWPLPENFSLARERPQTQQ